ncbi:glutamate--cysteine ligase catalytic subunit-like isoform X2 [Anneissia japonica]|uniref:glutamate--cysteine ligase catalytic subunit-like isoform X2 n=1 Tax=Anneissia japonica TaxID=1529436 RepID=UPI0014254E5D|nr:glutamate--cysteine ligase catalytic subunit-like isoform X2 [Anneissia japonica]
MVMGLLSEGTPLTWEETKKYADHVRYHGVQQFINLHKRLKDRKGDVLKWGDEVEYVLIRLDPTTQTAKVNLKSLEILELLKEYKNKNEFHPYAWSPEYADFMVEGTPATPYGGTLAHVNTVEANMQLRRQVLRSLMDEQMGEIPLTLTSYPRLGCANSSHPSYEPNPSETSVLNSIFIPDEIICSSHPRFRTFTRNIRKRRGEKICINVPIYKDLNTPSPFIEKFSNDFDGESARVAAVDHIYMDATPFGLCNSCLQMTFQCYSIEEARLLYDQLIPLCPIMMALSAACPFFRGFVSDIDCRWYASVASADDRTAEERGLKELNESKHRIYKSRFDSVDSYLSESSERYNDIDLVIDKDVYKRLIDAGIDQSLARHISHLFIRDSVSIFSEHIHQDDSRDSDHFENIQSTNWQTIRFKPPPVNSTIGWRVEFRPMDVQLTDFENAAYVVFLLLITRIILSFKLDFLMPISKVDANLIEGNKRDAVLNGKFYFRKDVRTCSKDCKSKSADEYALMDINTIINGGPLDGEADVPGIIPLINQYLQSVSIDVDTRYTILAYLNLISDRAAGKLKTTARWMRDYVRQHPDYKHDSVITDKINYDLLTLCNEISKGVHHPEGLLHKVSSRTKVDLPSSLKKQVDQENATILKHEMAMRSKFWPELNNDNNVEAN